MFVPNLIDKSLSTRNYCNMSYKRRHLQVLW